MESPDDELVEVRATINLDGLPRGRTAWVDPTIEEDAELIRASYIVPTGRTRRRAEVIGS